jgi:uncharacterized SAM-binding protein YcdF (DUF218 family)
LESVRSQPQTAKRPRWKVVARVVAVVLVVWLSIVGLLTAAVILYGMTDRAQPADVIIVLGSGLRRDSRPGPALIRRAQRAAELYAQGYAPAIICTGGYTDGRTRSEADGCREVLEASGVPAEAIFLEERSRSTEENAFYAEPIMQANGWRTAVLVSDGYHLLRAQWIFSQEGITVYPSPAPPPLRLALAVAIAREIVALHWQAVKDLFNLPVTYVPYL